MSAQLDFAEIKQLKQKAAEARRLVVETVHHAGAGHIGGPLSAIDMLVSLYFDVMNINPSDSKWEDRDRFVLSKGHSAIALYTVLAKRGYFPIEELSTFDEINSRLQAHPDMNLLPGLDMSSGSLGQGISAAVGMALGAKQLGKAFYTYCMIGDGESQEGQVWEAADIAVKYKLDNLIVLMDFNQLQQFGWDGTDGRERERPVTSPAERFKAFGWHTISANGHDFQQIIDACNEAKEVKGKPTMIIAETIKGKGVSFMENQYLWHSKIPTAEELKIASQELMAGV
ncbi:transketolase [Domibacillus aminovorans]|uniref:Transketolase n=1 Tax=Domibacillus aminovorans TaxID=29332 RepID=A0A177L153_9BACI|nr:transketolase [Domibacillus aminovorans]OAH58995.1 transketolase [Domibacillus aminovorans]